MNEVNPPKSPQSAKIKRARRQGVRVLLQIFPLIIGLAGLYFISNWSLMMRMRSPGSDVEAYYLGLALILLALMMPMVLEVNRRRTKKLGLKQVALLMCALVVLMVTLALSLSPLLDEDTVNALDRAEWDLMHDDDDGDDHDEGDESEDDSGESRAEDVN